MLFINVLSLYKFLVPKPYQIDIKSSNKWTAKGKQHRLEVQFRNNQTRDPQTNSTFIKIWRTFQNKIWIIERIAKKVNESLDQTTYVQHEVAKDW